MKIKNIQARNFYFEKIKTKLFDIFKNNFNSMLEKKQKYILSLLSFRKNYIKKLFNALRLNKIIRKNKKKQYQSIKEQRDSIIFSTLIQMLITNVSKAISYKEEIIKNLYIKRSSRGIQTALLWFKKLKNKIRMKKLSMQPQNPQFVSNKIESEQMSLSPCFQYDSIKILKSEKLTVPKHKENVLEDINLLITLKNKRRFLPKKIEFD